MVLKKESRKITREAVLIIFMAGFLIINLAGLARYVSAGIEFITTPFMFSSSRAASSLALTLDSFTEISKLRNENNSLRIDLAQNRAKDGMLSTLIDENLALKKELKLGENEDQIIEAEVLSSFGKTEAGSLLLNKGSAEGVELGDTVRVGNIYLGSISNVTERSSTVMLPTNSGSVLSAFILRADFAGKSLKQISAEISDQDEILGVAVGESSGIIIEDISNDAEIEEGYSVVTNDEKVGQYMFLGKILKVIEDPSAVEKQARVQPGIDYSELKYVFIITD